MDANSNLLVPKFMFNLNNQSTSLEPRNEAFRFRDGIVIVTTPVHSANDIQKCLNKACRNLQIPLPRPTEVAQILHGPPAMRMTGRIRYIMDFLEKNRRLPDPPLVAKSKPSQFCYFDRPLKPPPQPIPLRPTNPVAHPASKALGTGTTKSMQQNNKSAAPRPSNRQDMPTTEHIKNGPSPSKEKSLEILPPIEENFVDGRDWQDRLVPSAKMENARRKYKTKCIEQEQAKRTKEAKIWDLNSETQEDVAINVPVNPVLLTRDEPRGTVGIQPSYRLDLGPRILVWRTDVAKALGIHPQRAQPFAGYEKTTLAEGQELKPESIDYAAERRKKMEQDWRRPKEQVTANKSTRLWPTSILSRDNKPTKNIELGVLEAKGNEECQDATEVAKVSAKTPGAIVDDFAIVLKETYEVGGTARS